MTKKNKVELKRVGMNLPVTIVNQVEDYANSLGLSVTSAYIVLLNRALEQKDMFENLPLMFSTINKIKQLETETNLNSTEK